MRSISEMYDAEIAKQATIENARNWAADDNKYLFAEMLLDEAYIETSDDRYLTTPQARVEQMEARLIDLCEANDIEWDLG